MTRCDQCRREIRWGSTTDLHRLAVDWRPHPEGTIYLFPRGHRLAGLLRLLDEDEIERAKKAGYPLYRKHSTNCPALSKREPDDQMELSL